jgi:hypothetical protein
MFGVGVGGYVYVFTVFPQKEVPDDAPYKKKTVPRRNKTVSKGPDALIKVVASGLGDTVHEKKP